MRVGITGASGFLGRHLTTTLVAHGIDVVGFSRRPDYKVDGVKEMRGYDNFDVSDLDVVIHLAGETVLGRWTEGRKQRIRESRVEGTQKLVQALSSCESAKRPKVLISASGIGVYGDSGDATLTEETGPGDSFLASVVQDWESEAEKASDLGVRVVLLRIPMVLGRNGGPAELLKKVFKSAVGGKLGSGRQWMSWIHVSDLCQIFIRAIEDDGLAGPINAVAPNAVSNREFTRIAARVANRPAIFPVPKPIIDIMFGEMGAIFLESQRAIPRKLNEHGFSWEYADLESALADAFR